MPSTALTTRRSSSIARRVRAVALGLFVLWGMAPAFGQASAEPVLEAHLVPAEQREAIDAWRQALPPTSRTVWDERTGRLLLLAPLETHADLLRLLAEPTPQADSKPGPAAAPAAVRQAPPRAERDTGRLHHLTPDELHSRLETLARRPLPATWDADRTVLSFPAMLNQGVGVRFRIDARTGEVAIDGPVDAVRAWRDVVSAMEDSLAADSGSGEAQSTVRIVSTSDSQPAKVRGALRAIQAAAPAEPAPERGDTAERPDSPRTDGAILGPVRIEFVDGLDVIVLRGDQQDVDRVMAIIDQIETLSAETTPEVRVRRLQHIDSDSLARLLTGVYQQVLGPRVGDLSVTGLAKPNAVLLAGRQENVQLALGLIDQLDQPVEPTARFEAYPLKHASAEDVKALIDDYFSQQAASDGDEGASLLRSRAFVVADYRSNVVIVSAAPRDQAEVRSLVQQVDAARGEAVDEVRVFPLKNALAEELAEVIQQAIDPADSGGDEGASPRAAALRLGAGGGDPGQFESGVLTGVRVSPDTRANALVVTAPADSMELIAALVERLDRSPDAQAELKVFTVANGDAVELAAMLRSLFGTEDDEDEAGGYGSGSLSPLNVSVDERTNSILAAGSAEDLAVVEAILLRLDDAEVRQRQTTVFRLRNADAVQVAEVLQQWLENEREAEEDAELAISPREQIEREVVVVAEAATNSLIVSATPRYELELRSLVEQLDERPPMVMIQVLIAEVGLNDTDEFGVELGLQDSLLFDRSLLSDVQTISTTVNEQSPGGATITTQTDRIISSELTPGFDFNNQELGNNGSDAALATAGNVAAQALSSFSLGRVNDALDFGGFVFSASSSNLSMLLRALQETRRLEVLSRPQIMTLDRRTGTVQVGARVPRITSVNNNQFGQSNSIVYENVGIILEVTPRISPDGQVVMEVLAEKSEVGEEEDGIPINVSNNGDVIRAPQIETTTASTTISAASGQTVVLSGLLTKRTFDVHRRVPLLANVPLLGDLFRYDGVEEARSELLIILTPRVVRSEIDTEMIKQVESSRMSWVLSDVIDMHGPSGLRTRGDAWDEAEACFPTHVPAEAELTLPALGAAGEPDDSPEPLPQADAGVEPVSYSPTSSTDELGWSLPYGRGADADPQRLPQP